MEQIILQLRCMQLFTHNAHNLMGRMTFFSDHEFFGEVYPELENDYDSVVERTIGLISEQATGLNSLPEKLAQKLKQFPCLDVKDNNVFFQALLSAEIELCKLIKEQLVKIKGISPGIEQLLGEICNKSEMRQYKIKQRLKK